MTPAEAVAALDALNNNWHGSPDREANHGDADDILLAVVPAEVREAWMRAQERDEGWWWS